MSKANTNPDFLGFTGLLSESEQQILARVREFLHEEVKPLVNKYWEAGEFPHELIGKYRALGLAGTSYEGYGEPKQAGTSLLSGMIAMESSRVDASVATFYGVHSGLAMFSIYRGGSPEQRDRWLPSMAAMDKIGAFAMTEPHGGSDVAGGMQTTATREGDSWILNGAKRWIGNATFADLVVVWARDTADDNVKGFLVERDVPGFEATKIEGKIAFRIVENADITLTDVRVPEANRLQRIDNFHDVADILRATRAGVAWQALGVMIGAYEAALAYARERTQFGRPIARFQLVQDLLARSIGDITACWAMLAQLAAQQDAGIVRDEQSSLAKAYVTTRMREVVARCREIFGGNGIVLDYDVARFFADAEAIYSFEGTREMNSLIVGKAITGESAFV
jgi:glutaryl-CoA dehydrogenase